MPLRDHFRSPVKDRHTWDSLHAGWHDALEFFDALHRRAHAERVGYDTGARVQGRLQSERNRAGDLPHKAKEVVRRVR